MSNFIKSIQEALRSGGFYKGKVDGIVGAKTAQAVQDAIKASTVAPVQTPPAQTAPTTSATTKKTSGFKFSTSSRQRLIGVNAKLVSVVTRALELSTQDFAVLEGLRSKERQAELVRTGASQTMNSKHLTGHAVDLVPVVGGKVSWDWQYYYPIAEAMRAAAKELGVTVRWGGAWVVLNDTSVATKSLVEAYTAQRRAQGRKAFTDGPHYELV